VVSEGDNQGSTYQARSRLTKTTFRTAIGVVETGEGRETPRLVKQEGETA